MVSFKAGESSSEIRIPITNDPSGVEREFVVSLGEVGGRDVAGEITSTKVTISNEACQFRALL